VKCLLLDYIQNKILKEILKRKGLNTNKEIAYRKILRLTKNVRIKKLGGYYLSSK
jgi:hypothetical protein